MRNAVTKSLTEAESSDLLTTGEAAKILGTSRQHIVDLCTSGDLPHQTVGRHRRVLRSDIELLRTRTQRLTRDQLRSLWLAHSVAAHLTREPDVVLDQGHANLERMLASSARGAARTWLNQWQVLLAGPVEDILEALTSRSPRSRELRQNTPFAGVLSEDERKAILAGFALARHESPAP